MGYPSMPEERSKPQTMAMAGDILLPGPQLTVPAVRETKFPVRHADWLRLRRMIARLADPLPSISNVAWGCVGISSGATFAYFPWVAADSQLPIKAQQHYSYISPLLIVIAIAGVLITLFILFTKRSLAKMKTIAVEDILADMDTIYKPYDIDIPEARKDDADARLGEQQLAEASNLGLKFD